LVRLSGNADFNQGHLVSFKRDLVQFAHVCLPERFRLFSGHVRNMIEWTHILQNLSGKATDSGGTRGEEVNLLSPEMAMARKRISG